MRKIKRLLISVLVASMFMQFVPISNLGVKVYADEDPNGNPDEVEGTEEVEETGEPIEEPVEESEGTEEAGIPMLLSAGLGAKAGKYVVTLQPIRSGSSDYYELSFKIFNGDNKIYDSGNLSSNIVDNERKWSDIFTRVELNEDPTDIQIIMRYKPNAGGEGDDYEDLVYEVPFPSSCKDVVASAKLNHQYPDWAPVDFCKYSIQSIDGNGDLYYIDADGQEQVRPQGEYEVFGGTFDMQSSQEEAWYAVTEDISIQELLVVGNVHLVLCDETKLDVYQAGIEIFEGSSLTIYAQKESSGVLNSRGNVDYNPDVFRAGIGGKGDITINGGHITALGGSGLPGIGVKGNITINGGKDGSRTYVNAQGGVIDRGKVLKIPGYGAGIGGTCKKITINGGTIEAIAGDRSVGIGGRCDGIYINGGDIYAFTPKNNDPQKSLNGAAAIGAGNQVDQDFEIVITGGHIEAISSECGAGIGGSGASQTSDMAGGIITISGEDTEVYAASCYGAGVGTGGDDVGFHAENKGASAENMEITIKDGAYVYGVSLAGGAGIGGGVRGEGGHIVIDNATVIAQGGASHVRGWPGDLNPSFKKIRFDGLNVLEGYINEALASVIGELLFSEDVSGAGIGGGAGAKTGYVEIKNGARVEAQSGYMTYNAIGRGNNVKDESYSDRNIYEMAKVTYGEYNSDNKTIKIIGENKAATSPDSGWLSRNYRYVRIEPADIEVNFDLGEDDEGQSIIITAGTGTLSPVYIPSGSTIDKPEDPVYNGPDKSKEYIFDDWYEDSDYTKPFDFTKPIIKNTKIYCHWIKAYPLSITKVWKDNQTPPEKVDISYVNKYKKDAALESPEHIKEGTITLSADNSWTGIIPVVDSSNLTLTESALGYTADSWGMYINDNGIRTLEGQSKTGEKLELSISDSTEQFKQVLHGQSEGKKAEIVVTNKRGYTVHKTWDGPDSQEYYAGTVKQKFYWKNVIDHVYAVLQEKQDNGSWVTVGEPVKLGEDYYSWKGNFSYQTDESKEYRVRELITDEKVVTQYGTGYFTIEDGETKEDGHKEKILYVKGEKDSNGVVIDKDPVIKFVFTPINSKTPITGTFSVSYDNLDTDGNFKITNRKESSFSVKMQWDPDTEEKPAPKPEKIKAVLQHRNDSSTDNWEAVETVELTSENNWEASFSTIVDNDVDAKAYYRIREVDLNGNIVADNGEAVHTIEGDGSNQRNVKYVVGYLTEDSTGVTTITNKPRSFAYQKIWGEGSETPDPDYKTWFVLQYRNPENSSWELVDRNEIKRGEAYNGTLLGWFDGQYRIREAAYPTGKSGAIIGKETIAYATGDAEYSENGNTLTFRDDPYGSTVTLRVYEVSYDISDEKTTITNTPKVSPIPVKKTWNSSDENVAIPDSIRVVLQKNNNGSWENVGEPKTLSSTEDWITSFEIDYSIISEGKINNYYRIREVKPSKSEAIQIVYATNDSDKPTGSDNKAIYPVGGNNVEYDVEYKISNDGSTEIINKSDKLPIQVKKVWDGNPEGEKPSSVQAIIQAKNTNGWATVGILQLDEGNNWQASIDVPKNRKTEDGQDAPIEYRVRELREGNAEYEKLIVYDSNDVDATLDNKDANRVRLHILGTNGSHEAEYTVNYSQPATGEFVITNKLITEVTSVKGSKTWSDYFNIFGKRPNSITIRLYANNIEKANKVVTAADKWSWKFENLPEYDDSGEKITYTITEDAVDNYTSEVKGYNVTNTYNTGYTQIYVKKVWDDNDDQDGIRPDYVIVNLLADGTVKDTIKLTEGTDWMGIFGGIPVGGDSDNIVYTIEEKLTDVINGSDEPGHYKVEYSGDAKKGFVITNTHTAGTELVSGKKTWKNDTSENRPESITIRLLADNKVVDTKTVKASDGWKWRFENLPREKDGKKINYTISEDPLDNYSANVDGYDVYNTYTPGKTEVNVTKVWDDGDDADGIRPEKVTVTLFADGQPTGKSIELSSDSGWRGKFKDLNTKNASGKEITYTVEEEDIKDAVGNKLYTSTIASNSKRDFMITNKHTFETIAVRGEKHWSGDLFDIAGKRPDSITIRLLANNKEVSRKIVRADDGWKWNFENVPRKEKGKEIIYSISEDAVDNYTTIVNGFDVTNTYKPGPKPDSNPDSGERDNVPNSPTTNNIPPVYKGQSDLCKITYVLNGGTYNGSTEDIVEYYQRGVVIKIHEAPYREGYTLDYWEGSKYQPGDEYVVTGDHTFTARWNEKGAHNVAGAATGDDSKVEVSLAVILASIFVMLEYYIYRRRSRHMNSK